MILAWASPFNNLTWELKVPGTWELEVPGTWELGNLKFRELGNFETWELRNLGTHSRVSLEDGVKFCFPQPLEAAWVHCLIT